MICLKIRNDFVTNSSSSSFIIAYKNFDFDGEVLEKYPSLRNLSKLFKGLLDSYGVETKPAQYFNAESIKDYIEQYYYVKLDEYEDNCEYEFAKELYDTCMSYLSKGYIIAEKRVDYDDNALSEAIRNMADGNDSFIIINGDD